MIEVKNIHESFGIAEGGLETKSSPNLWLGYIARSGGEILNEDLMTRAKILRGNVYVDELAWLPTSSIDTCGLETDEYDARSSHLAMVDRESFGEDEPFVFANLRYITRRTDDDTLPVEDEFDLSISDGEPRVEMSRFMSRHFIPTLQTLGSVSMIAHTAGMLAREGITGYATLELPLLRRIKGMGMDIEKISDVKVLTSYGDTRNCAVRIDGAKSLLRARELAKTKPDFHYARFFDIARYGTNEELVAEIARTIIVPAREGVAA